MRRFDEASRFTSQDDPHHERRAFRHFYTLSEKEMAQGFCDLFWVPRADNFLAKYSWLVELKYLHAKASEDEIRKAFEDADAQLTKYAADTTLVPIFTKDHTMKAATIAFVGAKEIRCRPWPNGSKDEFVVPKKKSGTKTATKKTSAKKATTKKAPTKKAVRK